MKKLNVTKVLMDYDQKTPIKNRENKQEDMTLRDVLLRYLEVAHSMGVKNKTAAYCAGVAIATGGENCVLEQEQYDTIKALVDDNTIEDQKGKKLDFFNIVINQQVKILINTAEEVKPKVKSDEENSGDKEEEKKS